MPARTTSPWEIVPHAPYRLERRSDLASDAAVTCLGQGDDIPTLLAAAEALASDLLTRGEVCVLCVVDAASGLTVARRPVWPPDGPRPGAAEDAWWRPDAEAFLRH